MFTTYGALLGLTIAIVLTIRKVTPFYALAIGALVGGIVGGGGLMMTVEAMVSGTKGMMPSVLRILASGVLVGALVKTGSATKIANVIVNAIGMRFAIVAVALSTMVICAVGVFIDISVITVAPIALAVGRKANISVPALLVAMIGGGKAGNIISPNPNAIATADAFKVELSSLIAANLIPALVALLVTVLLATLVARKNRATSVLIQNEDQSLTMPMLWQAVIGPCVVVGLLALRPICGVAIDPLIALPVGGIVCNLACGKWLDAIGNSEFGLSKVTGVAILLVGTGTIAGIVKSSGLNADMIALLNAVHLSTTALAPIAGVLMAGATASTTAGATIASQTFSGVLTGAGVPAIASAAMIHAGATVIDSLPHGSFFHATGGAVGMSVSERLKLIPYEAAIGLSATIVSVMVN